MRVLFVTSECVPFFKKGGLGDVSYSLPVALSRLKIQMHIILPYYTSIKIKDVKCVGQLAVDYDGKRELVFVFKTHIPGTSVTVFLLRHPRLNEYAGKDIAITHAFFCQAIVRLYWYAPEVFGGPIDLVHCHDWHTALIPLLLGESDKIHNGTKTIQSRAVKTLITIHNLLYQGETGIRLIHNLGVPAGIFHPFQTRLGVAIKLLREGLEYADMISTVSPTYAKEIMVNGFGGHVENLLKSRPEKVIGILNGIDQTLWDPQLDTALPVHYKQSDALTAKKKIKSYLQSALHLPVADVPLFGFVGRLEKRQKGIELIREAIEKLVHLRNLKYLGEERDFQVVILGTGAESEVKQLIRLAETHPYVAFIHTFDERLARRIYAGSDFMLVPSKFEPCGLTQMIAMRYGTVPVVRKTGGLADSVVDGKTGYVFAQYAAAALATAMRGAIEFYLTKPKEHASMVKRVMREDFSWKLSARKYKELYEKIIRSPR